jgi:hypothetical protein
MAESVLSTKTIAINPIRELLRALAIVGGPRYAYEATQHALAELQHEQADSAPTP